MNLNELYVHCKSIIFVTNHVLFSLKLLLLKMLNQTENFVVLLFN